MATKTYWLLEFRTSDAANYFVANCEEGVGLTKNWEKANRFRDKKFAEKHLMDMRAMHPQLSIWDKIEVNEHGYI